jgi:alcohol dehydrogenase, propanol-preferring
LLRPGKGISIQDVQVPSPQSSQVLVKVEACGVCHTDVDLRKGNIGNLSVDAIGMRFPVTLGHEIAGTVAEIGSEVSGLSRGDRVLIDWVTGDGECGFCLSGEEALCNKVKYLGIHLDGGYAEYVLVPHQKYAFKLTNLGAVEAAPLSDAGVTAYGATTKANLTPEKLVAVIGTGGVGLMAVQFASRVFGAPVIAVGRRDETLEFARKLGATHTANSDRIDAAKEIMRISGGRGVDAVVDLVCSDRTLKLFPGSLAKGGTYVMAGLYGGNLGAHGPVVTLRSQSFVGSVYGNRKLFGKVIELAESKVIQGITSSTLKLEQADTALNNLEQDKALARQVLVP